MSSVCCPSAHGKLVVTCNPQTLHSTAHRGVLSRPAAEEGWAPWGSFIQLKHPR